MTLLLCFLGGIVFLVFVLPVLQSYAEVITTACEVSKSKMHVMITKNNVKITKLNTEMEMESAHTHPIEAIGFNASEAPEYYDEDDDDGDEDDYKTKKSIRKTRPIGFTRW